MYPDRYTFADRVDTFPDRYTFADSFILQKVITANAQEGLAVMRSVEVCIDVAWSDADSPWPLTTFAPHSLLQNADDQPSSPLLSNVRSHPLVR